MKFVYYLFAAFFFFLFGCVEKSGYYTEGENDIISLICDVIWAGEKTINDAGETIQDISV